MWNQGNGNGQGNGYGQPQYGQQPQYGGGYQGEQDTYGRLNNARERGGARFPFIEGSGKYALCKLEEFPHSTDGVSARALLKVIESKDGKHPVGSFVVKIWKLVKPPRFPNGLTEGEEFVDFCRKLKGAPASYQMGNDLRVLMKERVNEQLARGTLIECVAVPNRKGTWINVYWNTVQQSPQDIAAMRMRLEQEGIPSTNPNEQASPQAMAQAYPGNPQYAQPPMYQQGAPHAVPQSGYPTANPAQGGYGMQQPGFAQPQQAAPQGPPPGGYLGNVPTNNGGNGNQGGW